MSFSLPIFRKRGDTYRIRIWFETEDGEPVNLTGCSALLTVNEESAPDDTTAQVFQLVGSVVNPATDGIVDFSPSVSDADNVGNFFYDVEIIDATGQIRTGLEGRYVVVQDITKEALQLGSWIYTFEGTQYELVDPLDSGDWCFYPDLTFIGNSPYYDIVDSVDVVLLESNYSVGGFPPTIHIYSTSMFLIGADALFDMTGSFELEALVYAGVTNTHWVYLGLANGAGDKYDLNYFAVSAVWKSGSGVNPALARFGPYARTGNENWTYDLVGATVPEVATWMRMKFRMERDTGYVRGKVWADGDSEPSWQYEQQDAYLFEQPRLFPFLSADASGNDFLALASISVTQL